MLNITTDLEQRVNNILDENISVSEEYAESTIKPAVRERYDIYNASKEYYQRKFPRLSKTSNLVSTDVADSIEWALPSLMKIFTASDEVVVIQGVDGADEYKADIMQQVLVYMLQRKNKFFNILYNFLKDGFITGMGILKCYWVREEKVEEKTITVAYDRIADIVQSGGVLVSAEPTDEFGNYAVTYQTTTYLKNYPKLENVLISEFLYHPETRDLNETPFVAHKVEKTLSHLRQMEKMGYYANVQEVWDNPDLKPKDELQQKLDDYYTPYSLEQDKARHKVTLYECYIKMDINDDGILEDLIITKVGKTILRIEENFMGRHPFFIFSPIKDPHRLWSRRSYADLIGELQDIKVALTRQVMTNIALSNDPKVILSEEAINIQDYIEGRSVIRKKAGVPMADAVYPMPMTQLHPWTFNYLEYIESQKENRTGVTRYNQGLDAKSLNKTATGIASIMQASNQRLELIARIVAEDCMVDLVRFIVGLCQRFIDQPTVIRIANKALPIDPTDLQGEFDLIVNAGVGISTREATMMNLQTFMQIMMQTAGSGVQIATPTNVYNLMKKWLEESGIKNPQDFITDPALIQSRMVGELQLKQQILSQLPPEIQYFYITNGFLPPEVMAMLPPAAQFLLGGNYGGQATSPNMGIGQGVQGPTSVGTAPGMVGQLQRVDNRIPQNVPRAGNGPIQEPSTGIGSF